MFDGDVTHTFDSNYSTSQSLLERVRLRDSDAWERFARLYGPVIYRWARHAGLQPNDAADVTQEVFHAVALHLSRFQRRNPNDTFRGWLWTITRNKVCDLFRHRAPDVVGGESVEQLLARLATDDSEPEPLDQLTHDLAHRALDLIQVDFEPRTWQAFLQCVVARRPTAEVAEELGMTVAAVYKAKSRVLQRLRCELEGLLD